MKKDDLKRTLIFDGAMGTLLFENGLKAGACPEMMNIEAPEVVEKIHREYLKSGADVITTNTFGGNRVKLAEYGLEDHVEKINRRAVEIAKEVIGSSNRYVAASVGPTGQFVEPMGKMSFEDMYDVFKEQIKGLASAEPNFILLETFNDLGEMRAALLAAKDVCHLPVICTLTYEGGRTLTGVSPESAAVVLESLGAAAIGANCSGGPEELFSVVEKICHHTKLPVIVQPNAGLPQIKDAKVFYPLTPNDFIQAIEPYFGLGMNLFGSCCGSSPEHTKALKERVKEFVPPERFVKEGSVLASRESVVSIGKGLLPKIIGERINPTARKKLGQSLRDKTYGLIQNEAEIQVQGGAHLLDVNVGIHGIDEVSTMYDLINLLQQNIHTPLVIDSTNPAVIEKALQAYQGKALVNSINGEESVLRKILPIVKRYGAGVIALTLDEKGIPSRAEGRYLIAERIMKVCAEYGISKEDIYVDCLVLTVGTDDQAPLETLRALKMVKEGLGMNTVLGVSNVSHGLPNRKKINSAFLAMAIGNGLDLAIINPLDGSMSNTWQAASLLSGRDSKADNYIRLNRENKEKDRPKNIPEESSLERVKMLCIQGSHQLLSVVDELLKRGTDPLEIINEGLIAGLNIVGDKFEEGEYFLPQLMLSAEVSEKTFEILEKHMGGEGKIKKKGIAVIGTVKGDVHDIGKNMVGVMLRTHGFKVVDLGKNVSKEEFLEAAIRENADFIGLSALMTTTMMEIPDTIAYIKNTLPDIKVIAGGAVVTEEFAKKSGADGYSDDAVGAVRLLERLR